MFLNKKLYTLDPPVIRKDIKQIPLTSLNAFREFKMRALLIHIS